MKCPVDGETLMISSREGIEIDHCPTCRGVWLDRGELDKIIERSIPTGGGGGGGGDRDRDRDRRDYDDDRRREFPRDRGYDDDDYRRRKKKRSFLEDIFDFD